MKTILLIGTLDTKGQEFAFVRNLIEARGHQVLLMNAGIFESTLQANIESEEVAQAGGESIADLRSKQDRGHAISVMQKGGATLTRKLYEQGNIHGVLGLGGSGGTSLATAGMRVLPVGIPKLMVSTLASGDTAPYVDIKDITMMYSVVDIAGINRLSRQILANAAGMICGAVEQTIPKANNDKPLIAATMFGVTTPCVTKVKERLEARGYEVIIFHATGSGGRAMEGLIADGYVKAVADITTTELADELVGGVLSAGANRLEIAGQLGMPQVVSLGALDMVNFWAMNTVPETFRGRNLYKHNDNVTLMRTTAEENKELGRIIAKKLNQSKGKTTLVIPLKGVSMIDAEGQPFHDPGADKALFESLRNHVAKNVKVVEVDANINDDVFADAFTKEMLEVLR
jgi:uncharacterized protein (UPF0261 family)